MEFRNTTREEVRSFLTGKVYVSTHAEDADGICSALLLERAGVPVEELYFAQEFGSYTPSTNLMLDMVPMDEYQGYVIDHHAIVPNVKAAYNASCTSLMVLELLKDKIDPKDYWLAVAGAVGDGQELSIPTYIWKHKPTREIMLLKISRTVGSGREYQTAVWQELPWCINAMAKTNRANQIYNILKNATSPLDVVLDDVVNDARETLRREEEAVRKDYPCIDLREVTILPYSSSLKVGGRIASSIMNDRRRTALVVNINDKKFSLRGLLANYISELLAERGMATEGGHSGYRAGTLTCTIEELVRTLREEGL